MAAKQDFAEADVIPAYYRLQQQLLEKIRNGTWKPGEQIPPERVLAASSGLSIGTVKKAILNLVQAGYCYRVQGKGSFVSKANIDRDSVRYYRMRNAFQGSNAVTSISIVDVRDCVAPPAAAEALELAPGTVCLVMTRSILNEGRPFVHTVSYLDKTSCDVLLRLDKSELTSISLYILLDRYCNMPTAHCDEIITIENAPQEAAVLLGVAENTPLLCAKMLAQTPSGRPCEYRISYIRTTEFGLYREHIFRR